MRRSTQPVNMPAETRVAATDAKNTFGEMIERAGDGERIVITRNDRDRAVILSYRVYERLRALEMAAA